MPIGLQVANVGLHAVKLPRGQRGGDELEGVSRLV